MLYTRDPKQNNSEIFTIANKKKSGGIISISGKVNTRTNKC